MLYRGSIGVVTLAAMLTLSVVSARAFDETKYPQWKGQWLRVGNVPGSPWDPTKPWGLPQQAPLTPEYQAIFEANLRDQAAGGQGTDPSIRCIPSGMPRVMMAVQPFEIVITPDTTYVLLELFGTVRRIFTDGRHWPERIEPSFAGYSIGQWQDTDGDGRYDTLVAETRALKGPRSYDSSGLPLHRDNQSVIKERLYVDKSNPARFHNEITVIDNALTQPWTVTRSYRRMPKSPPVWGEYVCSEDNNHVYIGKENYMVSADGYLMPVRKGQAAPDLKYFEQAKK